MRFIQYLQETKAELANVTWPTKKETFNHTLLVIAISVFVGLFLAALDFGFQRAVTQLINSL